MRYKAIVSYDGTNYHGYQRQPGERTIQETIEDVFKIIAKEEVITYSSGRTDAHVHAKGQVFHFDNKINMSPHAWMRALNSLLPDDIRILSVEETNNDFHARFSAISKEYHYFINVGDCNVFLNNYTYWNNHLNLDKMEEGLSYFIGVHDFTSFSCYVDKKKTTKEIYEAKMIKHGDLVEFIFIGNGFLKYMVRIMMGALIDIGKGKKEPKDIIDMFEAKNRRVVGKTASPNGLFLWKVNY